jgi:hypothetical protein
MMKLNGVVYLTYDEVVKIVDIQVSRFSTNFKFRGNFAFSLVENLDT